MSEPTCCYRCAESWEDAHCDKETPFFRLTMTRMFVCPTCGNKRCPKTTDHHLDCTGSNAPGQKGSRYV
ncbi:hypothetical protein DLNHIDIE_00085 [Acidithiobacillus thiooxidans ATCC 19377]|uniref:Uncharacterized protein n=1 Tax=Acidithiobacillus thiooxidans ATCC 19377 TaxID=637390 RepID=A0A543Q1M0_ACITH|nr:hypothetical protein [Acidithiobacillus thiooxidans]MDX5935670.1 hypothetical protein [Acidithiobacillus thiooxidans]TQN50232.1 hypothetical protein DLNHIDIE_00085 [Acidithiobacillus thiooxidans ATCC 19377]